MLQQFQDLSIKWKLVLEISLLVAGISVFLLLFFPHRQKQLAIRGLENKAVSLAEMMAYSASAGVAFNDLDSVEEVFMGVKGDPDLEYAKVVKVNNVLYAWYTPTGERGPDLSEQPIDTKVFHKNNLLNIAAPLINGEGVQIGVLQIGFSLARINDEALTSILKTLAVSVGILALGVLSAFFIGQWVASPIESLQASVELVAKGNFSAHLAIDSRDEVGRLGHAFQVMTDKIHHLTQDLEAKITAHEQTEAQLRVAKDTAEAANEAKSTFLATMSHELRTPLNAIIGYAQILRKSRNLIEEQKHGLSTIQRSGDHLLNLINDILDLSKIEAGRIELVETDFHLPEMLQNIVSSFRVRAEQKGISFLYQESPNLPVDVRGDQQKLRQVLLNLLSNAVKFTDVGEVKLNVDCQGESVGFTVSDTGVGIATDLLDDIFDSFQQVGDRSRMVEGTGLGLSISKNFMQLMGSNLEVSSELGIGSTFWFELKLPESKGDLINTEPGEKRVIGYRGKRRKVLIVDDNQENRDVLVSMLTPIGFESFEAVNGKDGLEKTIELTPNLILMDVRMPVMDGFEVIAKIRQLRNCKGIKIITITASALNLDRQKSLEAGSDDFIAKPFREDALLRLMQIQLNLEWIYDTEPEATKTVASKEDAASSRHVPLVVPPRQDLTDLLDLAKRGDIGALLGYADKLQQRDVNLTSFAQKLRQFAKGFKIREMQEFIEQF